MEDWTETAEALRKIASRQIFFLGGAPRSGTTWLQQMLDVHPQASCQGEGLFAKLLYPLLDDYLGRWKKDLSEKNRAVFAHLAGYPLPGAEERHFLAASMILLAFRRQAAGQNYLAYGEKTPENLFFIPQLSALFPQAKFIIIARDPRDVLTSAWHFFYQGKAGEDAEAAKLAFIRGALPPMVEGARIAIAHEQEHPDICRTVTYEALRRAPEETLALLFRFLGLPDDPGIVAYCVEQTRFEKATGGRRAGQAQDGAFLRLGITGDWPSTLAPAMNDLILQALGWSFPYFGWAP
ncbi:MAG TPA: sulfotransferase [Acidisoma sp.]|uniref:sulfotransferase family protein n=1 Tax=Acidisoma sp. TaxID=1872115 RepID=UPI002BF69DF9|nr:sulfotransferase [Acidisoma sp.]HTI00261.1 sulfotransferase [Acidisoma sp.]